MLMEQSDAQQGNVQLLFTVTAACEGITLVSACKAKRTKENEKKGGKKRCSLHFLLHCFGFLLIAYNPRCNSSISSPCVLEGGHSQVCAIVQVLQAALSCTSQVLLDRSALRQVAIVGGSDG